MGTNLSKVSQKLGYYNKIWEIDTNHFDYIMWIQVSVFWVKEKEK